MTAIFFSFSQTGYPFFDIGERKRLFGRRLPLKEKFDIAPAQYADFKSLTGDTADNIKGAEGIGHKMASLLLG